MLRIFRVPQLFCFSCQQLSFRKQADEKPDGCIRVCFPQMLAAWFHQHFTLTDGFVAIFTDGTSTGNTNHPTPF